ncbi:MAG: triphosphoribosyl-dephospho-CoA synthase [Pirellulaceae bacterium]|nr:triphosphoribosyl-dephospho-CoA synthase [Pirellulaceae bacterium]
MNSTVFQYPFDRRWSIPDAAQLACVLEATAPKVGNVHPGAAFADMRYADFLRSAAAIGPVFAKYEELSVGELVLESVRATRASVGINTNLGTLLLFAPLAKAWSAQISLAGLHSATNDVLGGLTQKDSEAVYEAIRVAKPGGLGEADEHDVHADAPEDLVSAMRLAAATDAVAAQYANGFDCLFQRLVPWLDRALCRDQDVLTAAAYVQLQWLAEERDGLIHRKCGLQIASQVQSLARKVIEAEAADSQLAQTRELDDYLRADGHRRNPGTTADLIAATLFVKLLCSG